MTQPFPKDAWTFAISRTLRHYLKWEPPQLSGTLKFGTPRGGGSRSTEGMAFILNEDAVVDVTALYKNSAGETVAVDGDPVWVTSDPLIAALEDVGNPFVRDVRAVGDPGQIATITATANTLHGRQVVAMDTVEIAFPPDEAVSGELTFGTPRAE